MSPQEVCLLPFRAPRWGARELPRSQLRLRRLDLEWLLPLGPGQQNRRSRDGEDDNDNADEDAENADGEEEAGDEPLPMST
jgi:hypothetical protein